MPNINYELNLNKHPKDVPNRALVSARNVQLSDDLSCLRSEYSIFAHTEINKILEDKYLAGVIPCNKEFILFVAPNDYESQLQENPDGVLISLYRCVESLNNNYLIENPKDYQEGGSKQGENIIESYDNFAIKEVYASYKWSGGKIKGTFTYNIKSQLIIAIAESNTLTGNLIPLKTLNLGKWEDDATSVDTDLNLIDKQISLNPELKIPAITDFNYVNGLAYKGWYSFFIRYKINSVDYTKWYDIGFPIFIDELEKVQLFNYFIKGQLHWREVVGQNINYNMRDYDYIGNGIKDYISSGSNTCNKTIELTIDNKGNQFQKYQIGIIQSTKDDERAFKTLDIDITETNFLLDFGSLETYEVNDLLFEKYNYYDVKNIINYKNRLYLSNYKEIIDSKKDINSLADLFYIAVKRNQFNYKQVSIISDLPDMYFCNNGNLTECCVIRSGNISGSFDINEDVSNTYQEEGYGDYINIFIGYGNGSDPSQQSLGSIELKWMNPPVSRTGNFSEDFTEIINIDNNHTATITCRLWLNISSSEYYQGEHPREYTIAATLTGTINVVLSSIEVETTPEDNYQHRLKNTTLLPGETYNFYIHFVNKYGESTDGIKINICPREDEDHNIISYSTENNDGSLTVDGNPSDKYIEVDKSCYIYYPEIIINNNVSKEELLELFGDYTGFFLTYEKFQKTKQFCGILSRYDFNYDISYSRKNASNPPVPPDNLPKKYLKDTSITDNDGKYKFRFYCTDIDTLDVVELNFTKLRVEGRGFKQIKVTATDDFVEATTDNSAAIYEDNETLFTEIKEYDILNAHYVSAHNFSKGNEYRGSYIEIEFVNPDQFFSDMGITKEVSLSDDILSDVIFKVILLADTKNLYLSENKILIKFTNTYYLNDMNFADEGITEDSANSEKIPIQLGLNGFCTFNTALIYNNNQVILNTGYNIFLTDAYKSYISSNLFKIDNTQTDTNIASCFDCPFVAYITFIDYNNYPYESRRFKTLPEIISIRVQPISDDVSQSVFTFRHATIIQPMNSIDLFENKIGSQDNNIKKTYINYTNTAISEFNKRIIRSNPIADESFDNAWRTISPEAYKDITENKGNITNIVALGTTLLVHTEHSIFMFDRDNTLQSGEGGAMQLAMPDIFDVDYKEINSSYLGNAGLQDMEAYIVDKFGYVYYDNDSNKIYKFVKKKANSQQPNLEDISDSISLFISKYKPFRVRFANDVEHDRILVSLWYSHINSNNLPEILNSNYSNIVLSYNYKINKWISIHDYKFDFAFNTKQKLYYCLTNNDTKVTDIFVINSNNIEHNNSLYELRKSYNIYENGEGFKQPSIAIMINDAYEVMKTLEFLTWKLYKIKKIDKEEDTEFKDISREPIKHPFSGAKIRIYNDLIDTGYLNIKTYIDSNDEKIIDKRNTSVMNYKKPWYEFGNWNFNYFRDIKNSKKLKAKDMSRLYGNYFIIEMVLNDVSTNECVEFETLNCQLLNNKTI